MDVDVLDTVSFGSLDERVQVVDVRVNTSVRDQSTKMNPGAVLLCPSEGFDNVGLFGEFVILDA